MPEIPVDLTRATFKPLAQPRVNMQGAIDAAGAAGRFGSAIAQVGQGLNKAVFNAKLKERDDEIRSDFSAYRTHLSSLRNKAEIELKAIKVGDGVDIKAEAEDIYKRYEEEASEWIDTEGNVRHEIAHQDFKDFLNEQRGSARDYVDTYVAGKELDRTISRFEAEITAGIQNGDESLVRNGAKGLQSVGKYESPEEYEAMLNANLEAMNKKLDETTMDEANLLLLNGDKKGFKEKVQELRVPKQPEKDLIYRKEIARRSYLSAAEVLDGMDSATIEELEAFREDPDSFASVKGMDPDVHRIPLRRQAASKIKQIAYEQQKRASDILNDGATGNLELAMRKLEQSSEDNDRYGLPTELRDMIKKTLIESAQTYEEQEDFETLEKAAKAGSSGKKYEKIQNQLALYRISPKGFNVDEMIKSVDGLSNVAAPVKARIMGEVLEIAAIQARSAQDYGLEVDPKSGGLRERDSGFMRYLKWGLYPPDLEISDNEAEVLSMGYERFRESVDIMGAWDGLDSSIDKYQKRVRRFFKKNPNPSAQEFERFQVEQLRPIDKMIEREIVLQEKLGKRPPANP
jgi:hypothetical protein